MGKLSLYIYARNHGISLINLKKIKFFGKKGSSEIRHPLYIKIKKGRNETLCPLFGMLQNEDTLADDETYQDAVSASFLCVQGKKS